MSSDQEKDKEIEELKKLVESLEESSNNSIDEFNKGWKLSESRSSLPKKHSEDMADGYRSREYFFLKKELEELKSLIESIPEENPLEDLLINSDRYSDVLIENAGLLSKVEALELENKNTRAIQDGILQDSSNMYARIGDLEMDNQSLKSKIMEMSVIIQKYSDIFKSVSNIGSTTKKILISLSSKFSVEEISSLSGLPTSVVEAFLGKKYGKDSPRL